MTEVSGTFFVFFYSLGLASPSQKSSPPTMSSDRQFEKWLEGPPSTDQVRSRLDDYTTKIQDIAQVALDPDSAPFAEAKVKRVRANSNLIQQHLRRTEILAEWLLENIDEAADITPSRQTAETYLEYISALDLYHRAEEIQEELVALHNRAADTTLRELDLSLRTLSKETSQMKRKLREMESYPPLVELQQQITELIRKIERIRAKEALALAQKLEEQKREDALKVQLESARAAAAAHPHSSSTTAVSTPPESRHLSLASKIKLEVPKFDGNPLHWFQFWGDFEELIASNTSLTNIEKFTYLNQALLTPESQKIAAEAGDPRKNFDKSVKALKASYEDKRLIYQRSVQKFVETGRDLGLNRKDLKSLKSSLNGIETTMEQCEGDTLDQMKAAIMLLKFGRDLEAAWKRETTKLKEPPSTKVVVDFLDDQLTSISGTREEFDHIQPLSHPPSGKHNKKTVHRISAPTELGSCPACSSTGHSLARCNAYRNWGLKRKNDLVKAHNLCYNCLQAGHRISACTNKGTCRECKRRHHTTLHDPAKVVTPPAATTPASTNSTPSTEEVSNRVIRQPLLAAATASPMTLHEVHHKHHHPGPSAMEALLYQSYYPVGCRQMVKSVCKHCVVCRKALAKTIIQFMGDLPDHRISPARPFDYTGVDFAGPFDVKRGHTRKPVLVKAYACLFVCMSTKAVHIDCTEDLSTASFMLCFERFINRRGFPRHVYSDNGSNFIGAARTLGTPTQLPYDLQDFTAKTAELQAHGVSWHFIPERSPHCGGIWESGIRRMKEELRKTLHHFTPTAAEFHHLLITAEAVLNSRPLLPISLEEADSAQIITPGRFLIGRPIRAHPQDIPPPKDGLRKVRWSLLRAETEQLWKRWHTAYVQSLQSRQKWTRPQPNISVGDIVLLKDDSLKLHSWPLAKVTEVSPGPDGVVRVVTLTLPGGRTFTRHVRHLVPLMRASHCSPCPRGENVQDPRDGFGDYHSSSPERSQQRSQQP